MQSFKIPVVVMSWLLLGVLSQPGRAADTVAEFEKQLDFTIRSACHGYMVDAIPAFLSGVRSWLQESSPFCQTVRTLPENESAYTLLKREKPGLNLSDDEQYRITANGYNAERDLFSDCNDWMCVNIRKQVKRQGHPVDLADYRKVEQLCDGHYGCIEHWFKTWPRKLPEAKSAGNTANSGLSLDGLMEGKAAAGQSNGRQANAGGLSLDTLLGSTPTAGTLSTHSNSPVVDAQPSGKELSLDSKLNTAAQKQPKSADVTLDSVFAGREQLALEKELSTIKRYNRQLESDCGCTTENAGCYELPAQSLVAFANSLEQERYDLCRRWQQVYRLAPGTSEQARTLAKQLAKLEAGIEDLDKEMDNRINEWAEDQRRIAARRQQEQSDREAAAWMAGMATAIVQGNAVANGMISSDQGVQNSLNVARSVLNGENWASAMNRSIKSSIPQANSSASVTSGSANRAAAAPTQSLASTSFAICKTESQGNKVTAGCIGVRRDSDNTACSGSICAPSMASLCQQVGAQTGTPFQYFASGNGTFSSMGQCVAECENGYGEANWGEYGRRCVGAVSY